MEFLKIVALLLIFATFGYAIPYPDTKDCGTLECPVHLYIKSLLNSTIYAKKEISKTHSNLLEQPLDVQQQFESILTQFTECERIITVNITCKNCANITVKFMEAKDVVEYESKYVRDVLNKTERCFVVRNITDVVVHDLFDPAEMCVVDIMDKLEKHTPMLNNATLQLDNMMKNLSNKTQGCLKANEGNIQCLQDLKGQLGHQCAKWTDEILHETSIVMNLTSELILNFGTCLRYHVEKIRKNIIKERNFDIFKC